MRKGKGSVTRLLLRSYVIFALIAVLLVLLAIWFYLGYDPQPDQSPQYMNMLTYLKNGRYDQIDAKQYLGSDGWFEILDENYSVIYTSSSTRRTQWSKEELEYVENAGSGTAYYLDDLEDSPRKYLLVRTVLNHNERITTGIAVLDENYQIVYTDMDNLNDSLTSKEVDVLNGDDTVYLLKYVFKDDNGNNRTALLYVDIEPLPGSTLRNLRPVLVILFCTAVLLVVMLVLVLHAAKKIREPLNLLENSMHNVENGKKAEVASYEGPQEFTDILDSFAEMADKLEESEKKRQEAADERSRMLADISHDLKTPVTVMQGYAEALADGVVPAEDEEKVLNLIREKSRTVTSLVNEFYEYSLLDHPSFHLVCKEVDFCEYLREYLADKYEELDLKGFDVDVSIPEEPVMISFDQSEFKRVLDNILNDCLKENGPGTILYISLEKEEKKVLLHIGDNGKGIDPSLRQNLFDPFVTGNTARTAGKGTGLGLSIAYKIVEAHGGSIRLMNEEETTASVMFEISLPFGKTGNLKNS